LVQRDSPILPGMSPRSKGSDSSKSTRQSDSWGGSRQPRQGG
jgi:hypothetical protein